jgi:ribosomal 30S subunit maturation factor RimM
MALMALGLVGLEAVSLDGAKIGKVKDVISGPASAARYLVIKHSLRHDLVVPAEGVEKQGDTVIVPFATSVLDNAPRVAKRPLSSEDRRKLEEYYSPLSRVA